MKKKLLVLFVSMLCLTSFNQSNAQESFIGEVKMFAGNYAPRSWMKCEGQLLQVSQYSALFSILGTQYGGDGRTTFALTDMRGRVAMGTGNGNGLSPSEIGQMKGQETTTLTINNLPTHTHSVEGEQSEPAEVQLPVDRDAPRVVVNHPTGASPQQTSVTGNNTAVNNMQPSLSITYIICVEGIYPSRN
ncbi:MAG: phage tail protein [Crocinitomicaceae bacterium]